MVEASNEIDPVKLYNKVFYKDKHRSNLVNYPLNYLDEEYSVSVEMSLDQHPDSSDERD